MRKLITQSGGHRGCLGLNLRGECVTAADAALLQQAVNQLLTTHSSQIWVDCQALCALSDLGQLALLHASQAARARGITLYWCGLAEPFVTQLQRSYSSALMLVPASVYQGPAFLRANLVDTTAANY
jgi:anti-anti-sigma regulatory factor